MRKYHREREQRLKDGARIERSLRRKLKEADNSVERLVAAIAAGGVGFADIRNALEAKTKERD